MKAKVAHLTSVHPVFDTRIFHKEAKSLVREGYDVTLIAQHDKDEIVDEIRIVPLSKPKNRLERMTKIVWTAYRKALEIDADLYHVHDPELLPLAKFLTFRGKRVVYDMHENVPKQIINKGWISLSLRKYVARLVFLAERILLLDIPVVFAETFYHKDYLWIKKYTTILNMPLINELYPSKNEFPKSEKLLIGYIGGVSEARGSLMMIESLRILKERGIELGFECIGPIEDKLHERQLLELCEKYKLRDVNFTGWIKPEEAWPKIARCYIGLAVLYPTPNYIESYPTKMFEYMALGLPVIASNFPLYLEIVEGARCGICVDPLNPEEIAEAIQFIVKHPAEAKQMGENGRNAVEERYNWNREELKLLQLYSELI